MLFVHVSEHGCAIWFAVKPFGKFHIEIGCFIHGTLILIGFYGLHIGCEIR